MKPSTSARIGLYVALFGLGLILARGLTGWETPHPAVALTASLFMWGLVIMMLYWLFAVPSEVRRTFGYSLGDLGLAVAGFGSVLTRFQGELWDIIAIVIWSILVALTGLVALWEARDLLPQGLQGEDLMEATAYWARRGEGGL